MNFARLCAVAVGAIAFAGCGGGGDGGGPISVEPVFTALNVTVANPTIAVGGRAQVAAAAVDQAGAPIAGVTLQYVSSATSVATVDGNGAVTGVSIGQTTITVTGTRGGVSKSGTGSVTVAGTPPTSQQVIASPTSPPDTFSPNRVDVAVGGSVTWVFGAVLHNVIFATAPGVPADIAPINNTQVSRTFATAGTFNYTCTLHANMNGTVVAR